MVIIVTSDCSINNKPNAIKAIELIIEDLNNLFIILFILLPPIMSIITYFFYYDLYIRKANNNSGSFPLTTISYIKSIIGIDTSLSFNKLYIDSRV